jgi:HEAT repeat protein
MILEELVAELAGLGPAAAPAFLAFLCGELEGDATFGALEQSALLGALAAQPEGVVLAELRQSCAADASLSRRLVGLRVLERQASARAVPTWLALAGAFEPLERRSALVAEPLRRALARILGAGDEAPRALEGLLRELDPGLFPVLVDALAGARRPEGARILVRLCELRPEPEVERAALAAATALAAEGDATLCLEVGLAVRERLLAADPALRAQAAESALRIGEQEAVPALIELLEDDERRVQRQARASLEGLTGQRLGYAAEPWRRWYAEQERWLAQEGEHLLASLDGGSRAEAARALGELGQRRLFRDELVEPLAGALERPEAELVVAACAALQQLGSPRAALRLVDRLDDSDERVREAAWQALRALTRVELPQDSEPWRRLLERRGAG